MAKTLQSPATKPISGLIQRPQRSALLASLQAKLAALSRELPSVDERTIVQQW